MVRRSSAPRWHGRVSEDGRRIELVTKAGFARWLKTKAGRAVTLIVEDVIKRRSTRQNNYWWGYVIPTIAERCGYLPHEYECVHDELMRVLVGLRPDCHPALQIRVSSAALSTEEFNRLIEAVQIFAADKMNGLVLDDPDPEWSFRKRERKGDAQWMDRT